MTEQTLGLSHWTFLSCQLAKSVAACDFLLVQGVTLDTHDVPRSCPVRSREKPLVLFFAPSFNEKSSSSDRAATISASTLLLLLLPVFTSLQERRSSCRSGLFKMDLWDFQTWNPHRSICLAGLFVWRKGQSSPSAVLQRHKNEPYCF